MSTAEENDRDDKGIESKETKSRSDTFLLRPFLNLLDWISKGAEKKPPCSG